MLEWLDVFELFTHWLFMVAIGFYLASNLQWYNYRLYRVVLHHHRQIWHLIYFIIPVVTYHLVGQFFIIYFYFVYLPSLFLWHRKLDKPLVITQRIQRFFFILLSLTIFGDILCFMTESCTQFGILLPLGFTLGISAIIERILIRRFAVIAKDKLRSMPNLLVIGITASFGKTSLKNFLAQILEARYKTYATPRSVNTYAGIVRDINEELATFMDIYIVEAGAREKGDIAEIVELVQPHYSILGKIGHQHMEYFKTIENVRQTKMEILDSPRLKQALIYKENGIEPHSSHVLFPDSLRNVRATLEGTRFEMLVDGDYVPFMTEVLGEFNVINISAAIMMARILQVPVDEIQRRVARLRPTEHRLNKMEVNGKLILDDSFNGNLEGMLEAIRLSSEYHGRKVIVTPGLVESDEKSNRKLAETIDQVFNVCIITGELNSELLSQHIHRPHKIILKDKANMTDILKAVSQEGDLVLFANDAPNYV